MAELRYHSTDVVPDRLDVDPEQSRNEAVTDLVSCTDARLVALIAVEHPDETALDALVARHWPSLFARCRMLTLDRDAANDLAQETWMRVLQARLSLQPGLNFTGYLVTIARNIWCDQHRASRRSGPLSDQRLARLDDVSATHTGDLVRLADAVPDLGSVGREDEAVLRMDIDRALARLSPQARDLITARFLDGESAAEIGRRYGRTEQTITAWLRAAIGEMRQYFDESTSSRTQEAFRAS
jgi:RNA polymerase sigma-70 factor, ECF subfamily